MHTTLQPSPSCDIVGSTATPADRAIPLPLVLHLHAVGNPDFGQQSPPSTPATLSVQSLDQAAAACRDYIATWSLDSGNWPIIAAWDADSMSIATIAYNGRVILTAAGERVLAVARAAAA